jgi:chromosome segregation ATPase
VGPAARDILVNEKETTMAGDSNIGMLGKQIQAVIDRVIAESADTVRAALANIVGPEVGRLQEVAGQAQRDAQEARRETAALTGERDQLRPQVAALVNDKARLTDEVARLTAAVGTLEAAKGRVERELAALHARIGLPA